MILSPLIDLLSTNLVALHMLLNLLTDHIFVEVFQLALLLLLVLYHILLGCCVCLVQLADIVLLYLVDGLGSMIHHTIHGFLSLL